MNKERFLSLRRKLISEEFSFLNDMQQKAVLKTEGPLLLLAGAGSGKTTVLINRLINILRYGKAYESDFIPGYVTDADCDTLEKAIADRDSVPDEEIIRLCSVDAPRPWETIAITFTNKAAGELRERLMRACGDAGADVWAHTFHSACARILRRDIERIGYPRSFAIYDEDDKKKLIDLIIKELNLDSKRFEVKSVASMISSMKDSLIGPEEFAAEAIGDYYKEKVSKIYFAYQEKLQASGALDFDDIICKTIELLRTCDDVREYYQNRFKYVLVDEYQDTNHAQYIFCELLAGSRMNLCVVGDDDQSIYKFRGATIANIIEFEERYKNAVTIRLEQNYRSTSNILNAANGVISNNTQRKGKKLWCDNQTGDKVKLYIGDTQDEEGQYICSQVLAAYKKGSPYKDNAILYRNHALSNSIEIALKRNGIPYRIVAGLRFFDRAEVKDMMAYLWVINNPADNVRLMRIINNPPRKIGQKALEIASDLAEAQNTYIFDIAARSAEIPEIMRFAPHLNAFTDMMQNMMDLKNDIPLPELYDILLEKSGYLKALQEKPTMENRGRIENIMELKSNIAEYSSRAAEPSLEGFLEEISLITDIDRYDENADAVTLMTIHSSKGLEFNNVFIAGTEDGLFPSYRSLENEAELEEERRLCYVAMTRAKQKLHFTAAKRRMLYGQTSYYRPSRFISEVPEDVIENCSPVYTQSAQQPKIIKKPRTIPSIPKPAGSFTVSATQQQPRAKVCKPGDRVEHKTFGPGVVKSVTAIGGDHLLEIAFEQVGTKLMMGNTVMQFMKIL